MGVSIFHPSSRIALPILLVNLQITESKVLLLSLRFLTSWDLSCYCVVTPNNSNFDLEAIGLMSNENHFICS
jgi:hypothetical protein